MVCSVIIPSLRINVIYLFIYQNSSLEADSKALVVPFGVSTGGQSTAPSSSSGPVINPLATSDRGLIQRQQEVMRQQDEVILDIERGVDRLHNTVMSLTLTVLKLSDATIMLHIGFGDWKRDKDSE